MLRLSNTDRREQIMTSVIIKLHDLCLITVHAITVIIDVEVVSTGMKILI